MTLSVQLILDSPFFHFSISDLRRAVSTVCQISPMVGFFQLIRSRFPPVALKGFPPSFRLSSSIVNLHRFRRFSVSCCFLFFLPLVFYPIFTLLKFFFFPSSRHPELPLFSAVALLAFESLSEPSKRLGRASPGLPPFFHRDTAKLFVFDLVNFSLNFAVCLNSHTNNLSIRIGGILFPL